MPEISKEQLEEWAQVVYENCGEGEDFSISLYDVVMEIRDASGYYERPTKLAPDRLWRGWAWRLSPAIITFCRSACRYIRRQVKQTVRRRAEKGYLWAKK